jgi:acetoin utilization protein AcuB
MNVLDIMTANPITIRADQSLRRALELMHEHQCKHLPVMSPNGHLVGVISDRDCRYALNSPLTVREKWQDEELTIRTKIRSIMTPAPIVVEPHAPADEAARLMLKHRIGCLPVMRAETLVGIITRSDLLVAFMTIHKHYEDLPHDVAPEPVRKSGKPNQELPT